MVGIEDVILIAGFDDISRDHDATLYKVQRICRQAKLKLNEDKCLFWCTSIPFFGVVISLSGLSQDPGKVQVLMAMPPCSGFIYYKDVVDSFWIPECSVSVELFLIHPRFYNCTVMVFIDHIVDLLVGTSQCDLEFSSKFLFKPGLLLFSKPHIT